MKYTIKIEDQTYTVEIEDLRARPVIAIVDGERYEVNPENGGPAVHAPAGTLTAAAARPAQAAPVQTTPARITPAPVSSALAGTMVKAPIPGVIVAILVKPGDEVKAGQELITLEAMKMKNAIRSTRDGVIAEIHVSVGQTVNHSAPLVSFTE